MNPRELLLASALINGAMGMHPPRLSHTLSKGPSLPPEKTQKDYIKIKKAKQRLERMAKAKELQRQKSKEGVERSNKKLQDRTLVKHFIQKEGTR